MKPKIINKNQILIWEHCGDSQIESLVLEGTEYIGPNAFSDCPKLKEIIIRGNNAVIDCGAFSYCTELQILRIEKVRAIGESAFAWCEKISNLAINPCTIGEGAFYSCGSLRQVTIGEQITHIEVRAFYSCNQLKSIKFLSQPPNIEATAFENTSRELVIQVKKEYRTFIPEQYQRYIKNITFY